MKASRVSIYTTVVENGVMRCWSHSGVSVSIAGNKSLRNRLILEKKSINRCLQIHRRPVFPLPKLRGILEAISENKNMICCRKIRNATSKCNALNFLCTTRPNLEMCLKRRKFSNA
jgi:hypothetical protein